MGSLLTSINSYYCTISIKEEIPKIVGECTLRVDMSINPATPYSQYFDYLFRKPQHYYLKSCQNVHHKMVKEYTIITKLRSLVPNLVPSLHWPRETCVGIICLYSQLWAPICFVLMNNLSGTPNNSARIPIFHPYFHLTNPS